MEMKEIALAFVKAQQAFGPALKTKTNPHLRSMYADLSACIEAVIDALNENGIALMQHTHECNEGVIVETVFLHTSGETISAGKLMIPVGKKDPQGFGSALTYARRYSVMSACGIAPEDDDGNAASKKAPRHSPTQGAMDSLPPDQQEYLAELAATIIGLVDAGEAVSALDTVNAEQLDSEQMTALWSRLDSKTRSAIKAAKGK